MRTVKYILLFILFTNIMSAQNIDSLESSNVNIYSDFVSRYIWRGTTLSDAPSVQPGIDFSIGNFTVGAWGSYSINQNTGQEFDLFLSYSIGKSFELVLTDYFFPIESIDYNYFNYNKDETGHVFELTGKFNGTKNIPITLFVATNFYGADPIRKENNGSKNGIQYSTYAELGYSYDNCDFFLGFNLTDPNEDHNEVGYYGKSIGIVNIGTKITKNIKITNHFSIPFNVSLIANPMSQKVYLVAGVSL